MDNEKEKSGIESGGKMDDACGDIRSRVTWCEGLGGLLK